jgi:uncharacterized delta-60 repeat protein
MVNALRSRTKGAPLAAGMAAERWVWPLLALSLALLAGLWFAGPANAAPGDPDSSFSGDGKVTTAFTGKADLANDVAVQSDGKIVVAGEAYHGDGTDRAFALTRYNVDGSLDTSFNGDGKLMTNFTTSDDRAYGVAIQPDGKIVAVGYAGRPFAATDDSFAVARYNPDGSLDTTFSGDGKQETAIGFASFAKDVEILPDGRIVVAGHSSSGGSTGNDFALARYNADGSLDASFDGDGMLTTHFIFDDFAHAFAVQPDGKMVAVGYTNNGSTTNHDFALARYNTDGSLDTSFSGDGKLTTDYAGSFDRANDVAMQGDGKIVAAGEARPSGGSGGDRFALARYNPDGSLDTTFSDDGKFMDKEWGAAHGVRVQGDGKIVAAGYAWSNFALARFTPGGTFDGTFSGDGKQTTDFGFYEAGNALAIQPDGKIVVAGYTENGGNHDFALARYYGGNDATPPSGSIKINGGAAYTRSASVKLSLPASDPSPGSGVISMRLKNDGGAWTVWQPYTTTKNWTLRNVTGTRTVYVQYRDGVENVSTKQDTIKLDSIKPTVSGMSPRHGSVITDRTPTIKATVRDNMTNLSKGNIRLYVAGKAIPASKFSYSRATDRLVYNSPKLGTGKKEVRIVARDAAGNVGARSWYFRIR